MKTKKIIVWMTIITLILAGVFAMNACQKKTDDSGITYELNLSNFDGITAYGEDVDLSRITIVKTENGESTEIALDETMVSTIDTSKIGARVLKVNYAGKTFSVPVVVMYRVEYLADGVAFNTQYVLNASELEEVQAPEKEAYVFAGWSDEVPEIITENITISAEYTPYIPELTGITATYGDKLSSVQLPYTIVGSWQFDKLNNGTLSAAGDQEFAVSFVVYETGETIQKDTLVLHVEKKEVVFSDIVDSFIYNGKEQYPTFKTDAPLNKNKDIIFYSSNDKNYTDAGVYEYYFEIDHPNYKGELIGTYEIKPVDVTLTIVGEYEIVYGDAFPKIEYTVEGFDLKKLDLLDLTITDPAKIVDGVGTYTLTATSGNPNVNLIVVDGTLVVNSNSLDVGAPEPSATEATYGDLIDSISFESHPKGKWEWYWDPNKPDRSVGDVGKHTYEVVFTPYDSRFEPIYSTVEIEVKAKELFIEVTNGTTFTYNGENQMLEYVIKDADGNVYDLVVLGNDPFKNAGEYNRTLTLEDTNYSAIWNKRIVVNKAIPETDFSTVFTANWADAPRLSTFQLPEGYTWVNAENDPRIPSAGEHDITAIFTPADTDNYETVTGTFKVVIEQATASIGGVESNYNFTYNGEAVVLEGINRSHTEKELAFSYKKEGSSEDIEGLPTNAGTYTVTIALGESTNYLAAESVTTTVTIDKASNVDDVATMQGADGTIIYGDAATKIQLPTSALGEWTLEGNPDTVGNAGSNTFVAIFTPTDADNYKGRSVEITVIVAKKSVTAPTISATNKAQVYTGETLYSGLAAAEGYTVTDNGGVNVGSYTVTFTLASDNYIWSDGTSADKSDSYSIVVATNQWTVEPTIGSWIYGEAGDAGSAQAMVGQITIEYKLADAEDSAYSTTLPTNAGAYIARFTAIDPNYATITETRNFTISKKEVTAPAISADKLTQIYTGSALYSGLNSTDEYTVTDNGGTNVGSYTVLVALRDKANYKWAGSDSNDISLTYAIAKAQVVISEFSITGWTYGDRANAPTASANFGTITYVYATAVDGEYTATVPTNAGTYYVKAVVATTENLIGATSEAISFTIAKAGVTINGANDTYSKVYNTKEFNITGVTASNGAALTVVITKNGETVEKMINAGEYTVTFSYAGDNNYLAATKTVTVTIDRATNTETVNANQNATYGNLASVIVLPEGIEGYWTLEGVDATTTVGNAGTNTFKAVFTSTTGNYNSRDEIITVTVAKATVRVPIVENHEFDEQYHNSGLANTDKYTITEDIGGIDHGTYRVVLVLNDPANYKWATTEEASVIIEYVISAAVNKWVDAPTIADSWEYESAGDRGSARPLHGDVKIEYKLESAADSAYSTTLPTLPGKYVARFTTTDDNYTILQVVEHFEITKRKITVPTQSATEFDYTGNTITSGIVGNEFYTVVDAGAINVQAGIVATATLTSEHYVWADGVETLARTFTYSIVKADIVISDPVMNGWTYGEQANAPISSNNFNQVVSYVYASAINGEYTATVPTNAGTYYVKAIAQGNDNLNGAESAPVSFTIAKAQASILGAEESYTAIYNNSAYTISGVTASNGVALEYAYTKNGEIVSQIWNAGEYTVTITLPETDNYVGDSVTVTVTITKIENTDTIPTYTATYGDKLSTLNVPVSTTGSWNWSGITEETVVGNAGVQTHTLVFTPTDAENYAPRTVNVTVTVYKKVVSTPAVPNTSMVYNGATQYSGLADTALYTVSNDGRVNVGEQVVTLTLVDAANYAWNNKDNASVTVDVTYFITKGTNALTDISYTESWTYGDAIADFTATVKYGNVLIEYTSDDVTYVKIRPLNAGTYKVRFTTTDTNCDTIVEVRTFTIGKATVPTPSVAAGETTYNGGVITSGIVSNDLYTVVDAGGANVGTYTAVLKLKDANNYKWSSTQASGDIELTYKVTKLTTSISISTNGWVYGDFQAPTVSVTPAGLPGQVVITYSTDGGATWSTTAPTEVGNGYLVKAELEGTDNYTGASAQTDFDIIKATPVVSDPWFKGGKYYKNQFTATTNGLTATYKGNTVAGTFTLGTPVFVSGTNASYVTVTFTPVDTKNYVAVTNTYYFTFVSVAYINNTTAYGSIEDALAVAGTGDVVWVRPHDADLGPIYIMSDVTIPSGVTLLLPYGTTNDKFGRNQWSGDQPFFELHGGLCTYDQHTDGGSYRKHADYEGDYPSELDPNKCVLKVILAADKTMINNGILEIAGELSGGGAYAQYAGFTAGKHATLLLDAGASVISNSGSKIYAAGFIRETVKNNGSEVHINSGATLFQPYPIGDYRDGSYMVAAKNAMGSPNWASAYNQFVMMNVAPTLKIYYGGVMKVWASLFTGSTQANNTTTETFIGSDIAGKDATILLTKSYSYLEAKYDPTTKICDLKIYGGAKTQAMTLTVKVIFDVTVSTDNCFFPIAYNYNITLCRSDLRDENGNLLQGADEIAIFDMGQRFKLMTGASLTIEEGARANVDTLIVYETFVDDCSYGPTHYLYPNLPAAVLTVNGELVCNTFGGKIYSNNEGASVTINKAISCTTKEIKAVDPGSSINAKVTAFNTIVERAVLVGATHQVTGINLATTYTYENGEWVAWHVSFDSAGGSACATMGVADAYLTLPTPTRDGYEFLGWYYNGALASSKETLKTNGDHTLTAQWKTEGEVWITIGLDSNGDGTADSTTQFNPADGMVYPSLPTPTKDGYRFTGWVYNGTVVTAGSAVTATGDHMLTAQWAQLYTITIGSCSNATVSGVTSGDKAAAGDSITISISYNKSSNKTVTVTNDTTGETVNSGSGTSLTFTMPASSVTITASSSSSCVTPDTLVTLADGTQKRIDAVQPTDMLLVWNFYEGKYDVAPASILMNHGYDTVEVLTLVFADGTTIDTINGHGFFDEALNEFVIINTENVADFVGHSFVKIDGDGYSTIELVDYRVETRYTEVWSILTVRYYNCVLEGLWSVTEAEVPNSPTYLMPFVVGEDMKYDSELMQADIEKYGLYTYEEFAMYCTKEQFEALGLEYFKIAVGKGCITREQIIFLLETHCS